MLMIMNTENHTIFFLTKTCILTFCLRFVITTLSIYCVWEINKPWHY